MPNSTLVRATVDNYGRRVYRRYRAVFNLAADTDPDLVEAYCEGLREIVRKHPFTRKDTFEIHLNGMGPHSLDVLIYIFFRVPDWSTELRERHRFILDALRLAKKLGVHYAFPTQTLHLVNEDAPPAGPMDVNRSPEEEMRERGRADAASVLDGSEWQHKRGS